MAERDISTSPASIPSSNDSTDKDSRRSCLYCKTRISSVYYDKHTLCASCRGVDCTLKDKCTECKTWTEEEFARYLKHRKSLVSKALSKSKNANKGSKSKSHKNRESNESNSKVEGAQDIAPLSIDQGSVGSDDTGDPISIIDATALISSSVEISLSFRSE